MVAPTAPPTKTTAEDVDALANYLKGQIGWTSIDELRKRLPSKHTGARKIEAMRYLGLLERDGDNAKLSPEGRTYASGGANKVSVMAQRLQATPLYHATLEWLHYTYKGDEATKTDVANHWHDHLSTETAGASGDSLGDAVVFFLRVAAVAGVGKFVAAGVGRETHLQVDRTKLEALVTGTASPDQPPAEIPPAPQAPAPPPAPATPVETHSLGAGLHVNVEIHIAADAKPATIEEIFKNMRKYLLQQPDTADGS